MPHYQAVIESPIPHVPCLGIRMEAGAVKSIDFLSHSQPCFAEAEASEIAEMLSDYFFKHRVSLPVSYEPPGTSFQQKVWRALKAIPHGQVRRYGELAADLDSSARAVANACRANPLPILVPCHRVIAVNGIGGYMGETSGQALAIKLWLLQHEGYV